MHRYSDLSFNTSKYLLQKSKQYNINEGELSAVERMALK